MGSAQLAVHCLVPLLLLRVGPELRKPAALGGAALNAGRRVSFGLGASRRTAWGPGELDRVVQAFRS
jgi:hypothetical protein